MAKRHHRFLSGERVSIDRLPDSTSLPDATAVDVFLVEDTGYSAQNPSEIEIYGGCLDARDWFLQETQTTLDRSVALADGREMFLGYLGGDSEAGYGFSIGIESRCLYGHMPSSWQLERVVRMLNAATLREDQFGIILSATRSHIRRPSIIQMVPEKFLLDVRLKGHTKRQRTSGEPVAGGLLSRSPEDSITEYLILDAESHLAYFHPVPGTDIDLTVNAAADVIIAAEEN